MKTTLTLVHWLTGNCGGLLVATTLQRLWVRIHACDLFSHRIRESVFLPGREFYFWEGNDYLNKGIWEHLQRAHQGHWGLIYPKPSFFSAHFRTSHISSKCSRHFLSTPTCNLTPPRSHSSGPRKRAAKRALRLTRPGQKGAVAPSPELNQTGTIHYENSSKCIQTSNAQL